MRRATSLMLILSLALVAMMITTAVAGNDPRQLRANLTGAAERPSAGDPDGSGTANVNLRPRIKKICFTITFRKIAKPMMAHIHKGGRAVAGPIVVLLFQGGGATSPVRRCRSAPRATINKIKNNPGGYYVNLHNRPYPDGAIRGQLRRR